MLSFKPTFYSPLSLSSSGWGKARFIKLSRNHGLGSCSVLRGSPEETAVKRHGFHLLGMFFHLAQGGGLLGSWDGKATTELALGLLPWLERVLSGTGEHLPSLSTE